MNISLKHRLTACLLAVLMLCALLPTSTWAADIIDSGSCGDEVTWTLSGDGILTISGKGEMSWDGSSKPWGKYYQGITKVVIKSGVTNVGYTAFENCSALTSVSLPSTVLTIDKYAFKNCTALTGITIPNSVTSINAEAFRGCTALKSITIPDSVTSIGERTFEGCTDLSSVRLSNNLTEISNYTFYNCTALSSITIPDRVTGIGEYAFKDCSALSKVFLPEGLTEIKGWAFNSCTALTSITIPDRVTSIGEDAFAQCHSLNCVDLPKGLTKISKHLFGDCWSLWNIRIPDTVTSIGEGAFGTTGLLSIYIPDGVTSIDEDAFEYCSNLQSVRIPTSVTNIGYWAFYECTVLSDVYYDGYEIQWNAIKCSFNDCLLNATKHYNWTGKMPAAPKISSSIVADTGCIRLSWSAVSGAEYYNVYRSEDGGKTYSYLGYTNNTLCTNTGVTPGKNYYYKIVAIAKDGAMSVYSNVSYRTADCARPVVKASNVSSSGAIKLSWNKVTGASKYYIYRSTDGENYKFYDSTTKTTYTNTSVTPGKTYYYKVKAVCSRSEYGNSALSAAVYRAADCAAPKISSSNVSTGGIKLSWNSVSGASKYYIYRSTDGGKTYSRYDTTTSTSYTNKSVTPGKSYYYKVVAVCAKSSYGNSAYSNVANRTADCAAPKLSIQLSGGKPQLKWSAVDGASKYYIYRSTDGKNFSFFDSTTKTSYTNTGAKSGTTYYYKLVAVCKLSSYGNSAYSNIVSIKSK